MTLGIDLREDEALLLASRAREQGVSAEQYAKRVPENDLRSEPVKPPISQTLREIRSDMPDDVKAKLHHDGASQIDHYVYGLPKREQ